MIFLVDLIFLLERYETDRVPFRHIRLQGCDSLIMSKALVHALDLSDQLFLSGQVGLLYALLGNNVLILLLEEIITSRDKTFPDSVGMLTGYRSDRLPFFLQSDHFIRRILPVSTILQSLGFLT